MTKQQKRERIIATINDLEARNALHRARVAEWNDDRAFEALKANNRGSGHYENGYVFRSV